MKARPGKDYLVYPHWSLGWWGTSGKTLTPDRNVMSQILETATKAGPEEQVKISRDESRIVNETKEEVGFVSTQTVVP